MRAIKNMLPAPVRTRMREEYLTAKMRLGFDVSLKTPDRRILEDVILPWYAGEPEFTKLLFVGCQWYTKRYQDLFQTKEYWTIEVDPRGRRFGSRRHIVDSIENLDRHIAPGHFDVIFYNGVFGWGIDSHAAAEEAFAQCLRALRPGGHFVFGWNDVPEHRPFPPKLSRNLQQFEPVTFPPLSTHEFVETNVDPPHIFSFFRK